MKNTKKNKLTTAEKTRLEYHCSLPVHRIESVLNIAREYAYRMCKETAFLANELHLHIVRKDMTQKELEVLHADMQKNDESYKAARQHIALCNRAIELVHKHGIRTADNQYPVTL